MFPRAFPALGFLFLTVATSPQAGSAPLTPNELDSLRQQLTALRESQDTARTTALNRSLSQLVAASASPLAASNAYVDAVRIDQFGNGPGAASRFQDWRKSASNILSHTAFRAAAQLHLKYLQLTLERAARPEGEPNLEAIVAYLREAAAAKALYSSPDYDRLERDEKKQLQERIKQLTEEPLSSAPFAKAYRIEPLFADLPGWEMAPGKLESILDKTIRPILRENQDARLTDTWDLQLEMEKNLLSDREREDPESDFNRKRLPRLNWSRANDRYVLDDRGGAMVEMLTLIRANPEHPDASKWVDRVGELLEKEVQSQQEAAPAPDAGDEAG